LRSMSMCMSALMMSKPVSKFGPGYGAAAGPRQDQGRALYFSELTAPASPLSGERRQRALRWIWASGQASVSRRGHTFRTRGSSTVARPQTARRTDDTKDRQGTAAGSAHSRRRMVAESWPAGTKSWPSWQPFLLALTRCLCPARPGYRRVARSHRHRARMAHAFDSGRRCFHETASLSDASRRTDTVDRRGGFPWRPPHSPVQSKFSACSVARRAHLIVLPAPTRGRTRRRKR
jgi:hypothetical protein